MRTPTDQEKIQAQSIAEIRDFLEAEYKRLSRLKDRVKFNGSAIRGGTLLNAIVLFFETLPADTREAIAREQLARYECLLEHNEKQDLATTSRSAIMLTARFRGVDGAVQSLDATSSGDGVRETSREAESQKKRPIGQRSPKRTR